MLATRMRMAAAGVTGGGADWWVVAGKTCVAAYQPIGAASLAASYINLANPGTYDAAPGNVPTWASGTGWTFTVAQYLTTGIVPASGYSMLIQFANWGNGTYTGYYKAGARFDIGDNASQVSFGSGNTSFYTPMLYTGNLGIAGQQGYRNGVAVGAAIGAWTAVADGPMWIGGLSGLPAANFRGTVSAFAIYNTPLTSDMMAVVSAAMAALT